MRWFRKPREVELDAPTFKRWLRAHRPPWAWFLGQPAEVQEALALLGDDHSRDFCIGVACALRDPQTAVEGAAALAGDLDAEESLVAKIAAGAVAKMLGDRGPAAGVARHTAPHEAPHGATRRHTMAGFGERTAKKAADRDARARAGKRFLGREPSEISESSFEPASSDTRGEGAR